MSASLASSPTLRTPRPNRSGRSSSTAERIAAEINWLPRASSIILSLGVGLRAEFALGLSGLSAMPSGEKSRSGKLLPSPERRCGAGHAKRSCRGGTIIRITHYRHVTALVTLEPG